MDDVAHNVVCLRLGVGFAKIKCTSRGRLSTLLQPSILLVSQLQQQVIGALAPGGHSVFRNCIGNLVFLFVLIIFTILVSFCDGRWMNACLVLDLFFRLFWKCVC